jgi:SAM-dependent methyltransferase
MPEDGTPELLRLRTAEQAGLPLRFVHEDGRWFVLATSPAARWPTEVLLAGVAEVETPDGGLLACGVSPVTDPSAVGRIVELFRAKYGPVPWLHRLPPRPRVLVFDPGGAAGPAGTADRLRLEFDAAAPEYLARVVSRPVERYLKDTTRDRLLRAFSGADPLLEVGPGSGYETIPLLLAGHRVTAVDVSERMLRTLRERAEVLGVAGRLETRVGRLSDLDSLFSSDPAGRFGGAYSTFGAFNLEPEVEPVREGLAVRLRPGARLVFTTANRPGLVPVLWEVGRGRGDAASRRRLSHDLTDTTSYPLDLYRRRPREWGAGLAPQFLPVGGEAVSVLAPPYDGTARLDLLGSRGRHALRGIDRWLARRAALLEFGEWALLTFERCRDR